MGSGAGRFGLTLALGVVAAVIAILPSTAGVAEPSLSYRQTVPLIAADSAPGSSPAAPNSGAGKLATDLNAAPTNQARVDVLHRVFNALHIGVYRGNGTVIVSGAETSAQDFYFYEPEVEMMAFSLARADRWSYDDLARYLNGVKVLNVEVTSEQLQAAVTATIREAQVHSSEAAWLSPLLVQQLGLNHSPVDDLSSPSATSVGRLDALQRTLILDDLLIGLPRADGLVAARSNLVVESQGILRESPVTAQGVCNDFKGSKPARNIGKFAAGLVSLAGKAVKAVSLPLDAHHGVAMAYSVKVEALADNLKTHYGHESPGSELRFPVLVRMLDALSETQIECGWIAGLTFPQQGPIPNVKIAWDGGALESHGKITCGVSCKQTGDDGIATLLFQPKQEQAPYDGRVTSEKGLLEANALYLSSLGNIFGAVSEVATPKTANFVWEVERHAKGTWEGQVTLTWTTDDAEVEASGETTTQVRFELGLAAPGELEERTEVFQLTQGTVVWSQSIGPGCTPSPKTGTTTLKVGSALFTVTEKDGMMTYEFAKLGIQPSELYSLACFGEPLPPVPVVLLPFWLPEFKSKSIPVAGVISDSTELGVAPGYLRWTWTLTKK